MLAGTGVAADDRVAALGQYGHGGEPDGVVPLRVLIVPVVRVARSGGRPVVHSRWPIAAT